MLKSDIGINAGIIWNLLAENGKLTLREIGELTNFKDSPINMALGWLSRENKIRFFSENDHLYIELNHSVSETYY
ncbi:winged helix-turn-helix domain-containing protein [Prevotella sp. 10(H)]|uniref:winged helix-turn-helix domain-containing protein n=1 Tax=Prevotella sp. 10(H) TaxID=1158294 RepID=UPI0004A7771C|nr:winged helix-turn-helix domain-containing protein [Prevotella sp. 10(H)]